MYIYSNTHTYIYICIPIYPLYKWIQIGGLLHWITIDKSPIDAIDSPCHSLMNSAWPNMAHLGPVTYLQLNVPVLGTLAKSAQPRGTQVTSVDPWLDKARLQDVTGNLGKRAIGPIGGAFLPHEQLNLAVFIGLDGFFSTTSSSKETQKWAGGQIPPSKNATLPGFFNTSNCLRYPPSAAHTMVPNFSCNARSTNMEQHSRWSLYFRFSTSTAMGAQAHQPTGISGMDPTS